MKESVAIAKEADAKKDFSPTKSNISIYRVQHEPERQLGSLRSVIDNITRDGGTPSVDSIATELSGMHTAERAPALLALQRTHGNRYVQQVVTGIQAKLKVGQPGDVYEQEADRVADAVMRMPEPEVPRQVNEEKEKLATQAKIITPIQALTLQCQDDEEEEELKKKKKKEEEEETLQAKELPSHVPEVTPELESRIHALKGGGQSLPESVRAFFEPRFGHDFSQVRVHTDAKAAESAQAVNARAFTMEREVVFGTGQYAPETMEGKRLLAHELTHVVQQGKSKPTPIRRHINLPSISSRFIAQPIIDRKVDVGETLDEVVEDNKKPKDMNEEEAADIGLEALRTVGYEEIIKFALEVGFLERKKSSQGHESIQRRLLAPQDRIFRQAEAVTFGSVFSRYAIAAGIASQVDTPAPGPGDVVALGILAVGLLAAGYAVLSSRPRAKAKAQERAEPRVTPRTPKTCATEYPSAIKCESLSGWYKFNSAQLALAAMKKARGISNLKLVSPRPAVKGPCPGVGMHYGVKSGGVYIGSIVCCPCCKDTSTGPVMMTLCGIV